MASQSPANYLAVIDTIRDRIIAASPPSVTVEWVRKNIDLCVRKNGVMLNKRPSPLQLRTAIHEAIEVLKHGKGSKGTGKA